MKTNKKLFYAIIVITVIIVAVIIYNQRKKNVQNLSIDEAESKGMTLTAKERKVFEEIQKKD